MFSNTKNFIAKAREIHGDKYDYSKVEYIDYLTPVCIICPKHGEFWQKPNTHLCGHGCQKCGQENREKANKKLKKTTESFIIEAQEKYGDKFDYSETIYRGAKEKITIIIKDSGRKYQITPDSFLNREFKAERDLNLTNEEWINKAKMVHGDKYDYSITYFKDGKTKIQYICPVHGIVEQLPENHLKYGCRFCSYDMAGKGRLKEKQDFIDEAKKVHGEIYDYSKVEYRGTHKKVCIICPKHGEFWQTPAKHLSGQGCPKCKNSRLEETVALYLDEMNLEYVYQYAPDFLKNGRGKQKLDFYLPQYCVGIECQGIQHFVPSRYMGVDSVEKNKKRDILKAKKCKENNIKLLYFTTKDNMKFIKQNEIYNEKNTFDDLKKLLNNI